MFSTMHITYIFTSLIATVGILFGMSKIKNQSIKNIMLFFWAFATFFLHISIMYYDYLTTGTAIVPDNVLFPIYFCNLCMYTLMIVAILPNKDSKFFKALATFVAFGGFFGAMITLFQNDYLASAGTFAEWSACKSMLSHSTMLVGSLYLFVGKYVKISMKSIITFAIGILCAGAIGGIVIALFALAGLPIPNAMYLIGTAVPGVEIFNGYFVALLILIVTFIFLHIWELVVFPKGERWFNKLNFKKKKAETNNNKEK